MDQVKEDQTRFDGYGSWLLRTVGPQGKFVGASFVDELPERNPHKEAFRDVFLALGRLEGKLVLDAGCGSGEMSIYLAQHKARVVGVDVSRNLLSFGDVSARTSSVSNRVDFGQMSLYDLAFSDGAFDIVFGSAILHHLDLDRAVPEIARVLKGDGVAVFIEPHDDSELYKLLRRLVPLKAHGGFHWGVDKRGLDALSQAFSSVAVKHYHLVSRLDRIFAQPRVVRCFRRLDIFLLGALSFTRRYSRIIAIQARK